MKLIPLILATSLGLWLAGARCDAAVDALESPEEIVGGVTLGFDEFSHGTIIGERFSQFGIRFTRGDGDGVVAYDYVAIGRTTSSPRNVLSTAWIQGVNAGYSTRLYALSTSPLYSVGAYFGNDRGDSDFLSMRLSVFGLTGNLLGSVTVEGNGNRGADQYIGITSDVPFTRMRFDNIRGDGEQSRSFAVSLDDFKFSQIPVLVPEPSAFCLFGLGLAGAVVVWRKRRAHVG